jgi:anti-sigma B factor antagonist
MTFEVSVVPGRDGRVVHMRVTGELDLMTVPGLDETIRGAERSAPAAIVLDLRGLTFLDSSGLRCLIQAHTRADGAGRRLAVVPGEGRVRRLFTQTQLDTFLDLVADPSDVERSDME